MPFGPEEGGHLAGPVIADAATALSQRRNCLVLTNWTAHLNKLANALRAIGNDPVILRGGMGAKARAPRSPGSSPSLAARPCSPWRPARTPAKGLTAPRWDTLFLAVPVAQKGRLVQYAGRILRPYQGKATAEVHDYHDELTGVLASSLAKRAPGYTSLGFPRPATAALHPQRRRRDHDLIKLPGSARRHWTIGFAIVTGVDEWDIYQTDEVATWLRELQDSDPKTAGLVDDAIYTLSRQDPRWAGRWSTPSPTRRSRT